MIRIFKTEDGAMHEKEEMEPGSWIALTNPNRFGDLRDR